MKIVASDDAGVDGFAHLLHVLADDGMEVDILTKDARFSGGLCMVEYGDEPVVHLNMSQETVKIRVEDIDTVIYL